MKNLIILGPPGSGKGTQAVKLADKIGVCHLSTGDLLRNAVKEGTDLGRQAQQYMERGDLVPDHLLVGLIESQLTGGELSGGFILDGFPRTVPQAQSLKEMLQKNRMEVEAAILLQVSDDEVVKRLSGRWFCPTCQRTYNFPANMPKKEGVCDDDNTELLRRPDDEEAVVRNRLDVYKKQTQPIEDFYRQESILIEVPGEKAPDDVLDQLLQVVKKVEQ